MTGVSLSDGLMSYPGHLVGESYPSAEMQLVHSTALAKCELFIIMNYLYELSLEAITFHSGWLVRFMAYQPL